MSRASDGMRDLARAACAVEPPASPTGSDGSLGRDETRAPTTPIGTNATMPATDTRTLPVALPTLPAPSGHAAYFSAEPSLAMPPSTTTPGMRPPATLHEALAASAPYGPPGGMGLSDSAALKNFAAAAAAAPHLHPYGMDPQAASAAFGVPGQALPLSLLQASLALQQFQQLQQQVGMFPPPAMLMPPQACAGAAGSGAAYAAAGSGPMGGPPSKRIANDAGAAGRALVGADGLASGADESDGSRGTESLGLRQTRRLVKNRQAARESRRRKKEYIHDLETRADRLMEENQKLRAEIEVLRRSTAAGAPPQTASASA